MSRCFPFPPPGYEKKPRSSEHGDLLAKEKHKEKKHKKEQQDKEKGESKERKDNDRSKDKHKEKKDRKEKHKDKKKDRDKDKNKTSEDRRTNHRSEVQLEGKLGNDSWKSEEVRDSKFTELGRWIRDEEQETANRMLEDFSATKQRRIGSMGASPAMWKESATGNRMVTDVTGTVQRRNEKLGPSFQKRTEGLETATIADRQKVASSKKVPDLISAERRRNDNLTPPVQKKIESMATSMAMEKQRAAGKQKSEDFTSAEQGSNQVTGCLVDNFSSSVERRTEGMGTVNSMQKERRIESIGAAPAMEKEKSAFPSTISIEQRRTDGIGVPGEKDRSVEKDVHKKMEGMEKTKEKKADGKREGHKGKDRNEKKRKKKDKERHKEKKKEEKKRGKGEHKHRNHDKLRASGTKDQIASLNNKNLSPHIENVNSGGVDGNNKKRKEFSLNNSGGVDGSNKKFEINGFLHEPQHDERPKKLPKTSASSSHPSLENGSLELIRVASPCPSRKFGAINNTERSLDNNDSHINGKVEVEPLHSLGPLTTVAMDSRKSDESHALRPGVSSFTVGSSQSDEVHVLGPLVPPVPQAAVNLSESLDPRGPQVGANLSKSLVPPVTANSSKSLGPPGPQVTVNLSMSLVPPVFVNLSKSLGPQVAVNSSKCVVPPIATNSSKSLGPQAAANSSTSLVPPVATNLSKSLVPPVAADSSKIDELPSKPPHPDVKYLSTIYSVPKMEDLLVYKDHQEWLFSSEKPKSNVKLEDDGTPLQVWAKGVQIDAADVFALPYVVPF